MPRPFTVRWIPRVNNKCSTAPAISRFVTVKGSRSLLTLCSTCASRVNSGTSRPKSPHWTITSPITQRQISTEPVSAEKDIKRDVLSEFQQALDDHKFRSARSLAQSNLFGAQLKQTPVRWIENALKQLSQSPSSSAVHTLRTILFDGLISHLTTISNRTDSIPQSATDRIRYAQELVVDKALGLYGVTPPPRTIHRVVLAQITTGNPDAAQAVLDHATRARIPLFQITFDCLAKERANKFNWEGVRWAWKRAASCTPAENAELIDQKQRIRALAAYVVMHGMDLGPLIFHRLLQTAEISSTEALYDILYSAAPRSGELQSRTRFLQELLQALVPSFKNVTSGNTTPSQLSRMRVRRISDIIEFMRLRQCVDASDYNLAFAELLQHGTDEELSKLKQEMDEANILLNDRLSAILAKRSERLVYMHDAAARAALREKDHARAVGLLRRSIAESRRLSEGVMNGLVKSSFYQNDGRSMHLCWVQMTKWQQQPSLWSYTYRISLALLEYKPAETLRLLDELLLASRKSGVAITEKMCITILRQAADHVIKRPNSHFVLKVLDTLMQDVDISLSPRLCELGFTILGRFKEVNRIEKLIERADTFAGSLDAEGLHSVISPLVRFGFRDHAALLVDRMGDAGVLPNQKTTELLLGATEFVERRIGEAQTGRAKADVSRLLRISDGEEFRSALAMTDIPTNVRSYTALITSRLKVHDPAAAEHLYQSLKKAGVVPNEVTFLQLINYFAQTQNASKVRTYLDEMEACNVRPTPQILASLITGLSKIDSLSFASSESLVFDMMTKFGIDPDTVLMNSLMAARVRHGDVIGAHNLLTRFAGRCSPNRVTFHILIHGYCESRTVQQMLVAEGLLKHIEQSSDPLIRVQSEHPYTDLIMNFAHLGDMRAAVGVLQRMQEHNVPATATTHAAIINGYCINGDLRNAWKHFNAIFLQPSADGFPLPLRHDVVVPLLKAYAASANSDDLFAFLKTLTAAGLSITSHMHNIVLSHLAQYRPGELDSYYQQHFGPASGVSEFTLLSILAGFKNSGASQQALRWFTKLTGILLEEDTPIQWTEQKSAVVPGIKSYTALLAIAPDAAVFSIYSFMMAQGVKPTAATICSIIDRYAKAGKETDVFDWLIRWEEVKACEGKRSPMGVEHLACLLEARGRAQNLAGVEEVWRWATHGCAPFDAGTVSMYCEPVLAEASTSVEPLVCMYLDNISRLAPFKQLENAWTQVSGLPLFPTSNIYTSYIEGLVRHGRYTEAVEFLRDTKRKHKPGMPAADSRKTLHNLVKGIRARDRSEALRVVQLLKMHNLGHDLPLDVLMA
ncbi:hypothetical protein BC832DRAFT_537661 [Gaertneriomyces semiglobifer]|nr:hypothetical protein BC832DRAFT_537661 [Gaertneriomyces semiglobifer]